MSLHSFTIPTSAKREIIDITERVKKLIPQNGTGGTITVFVEHTTAAITTSDLDPGTDRDLLNALGEILPELQWHHNHKPGHAPDHLLASIIGPDVTIPYDDGQMRLGRWQRIILLEFDGPRERNISVAITQ